MIICPLQHIVCSSAPPESLGLLRNRLLLLAQAQSPNIVPLLMPLQRSLGFDNFLRKLTIALLEHFLWCDNIGAGALTSNLVFRAKTKHIELDVHYVRDLVLNNQLQVRYVPTNEELADCLTKLLSHTQFTYLRTKLGLAAATLRL